jgi:hypothetical protein
LSADVAQAEARKKQALAYLATYIFKNKYGTNWSLAADISGYPIDWARHYRLTRAQFFHDDDYQAAILRFITDVYDGGGIESFKMMISFILGESIPDEPNLKTALSTLRVISVGASTFSTSLSLSIPIRLIDVDTFPDDFYRDLVHLINKAYQAELNAAVPILTRKLLENLLVDALRSFYGLRDVAVFFDTVHRRFHDFGLLIDNAKARLEDFTWCKDLMNKELLAKLDEYRERGNASAHSMTVTISKGDLDRDRDETTHVIEQLFKLLSVLSMASKSDKETSIEGNQRRRRISRSKRRKR